MICQAVKRVADEHAPVHVAPPHEARVLDRRLEIAPSFPCSAWERLVETLRVACRVARRWKMTQSVAASGSHAGAWEPADQRNAVPSGA